MMATQTGTASRRPKLSLSIKTSAAPHTKINKSLALVDPKSPTTFNTLSNVYATAIGRSTSVPEEPLTAINTVQHHQTASTGRKTPALRLQTPHAVSYPETPLTAHPLSPAASMEITFPSTMTATPPLSAGPVDGPQMFGFSPIDAHTPLTAVISQPEPRSQRKRNNLTLAGTKPPYSHPRSLHSILRNSPLPPPTSKTPISPRRQSLRLQEKAARRVAYNSPIEQEIINNKYTRSHIDLLIEDASPASPPVQEQANILDIALAFNGNEILDGGMTPGPFEDMRRRMAGLAATSPVASPAPASPAGGIRKKKRKEKKRRWVWTIGNSEEDPENIGGAVAASRAAEAAAQNDTGSGKQAPAAPAVQVHPCGDLPTPSIETFDEAGDVEMSDTSSVTSSVTSNVSCDRGLTPPSMDVDLTTPTVCKRLASRNDRLGSAELFNPDGSRRDTPIPPDMVVA